MVARFPPPVVAPADVRDRLASRGYAVIDADGVATLCGTGEGALAGLASSWERLAPDTYLRDGGRYRHRRHSCFVVDGDAVAQAPHRAHWQPLDYNALHGGMHRWFEPITPSVVGAPAFGALLRGFAHVFTGVRGAAHWYVEAHQFRIDTAGGGGAAPRWTPLLAPRRLGAWTPTRTAPPPRAPSAARRRRARIATAWTSSPS